MSLGAQDRVVIVGAGQAGVQAAEALRAGGFAGPVTLLGEEPGAPYHRPPLSKAWLAGEMDASQLTIRTPEALARKGIELRTATPVAAIDRARRLVRLGDGSELPYSGLVLATGASARRLAVPGADAQGVFALRSREDASRIAAGLAACRDRQLPVVVVGGGFIGLEVAATARRHGLAVTVLEAAPRLLMRALAPMLSDWYAQLHLARGADVVLDARLQALEVDAHGAVCAVRLADGARLPAGLVVVGVGVVPNDALARDAGLACDRGVIVDACSRTGDPAIVAAGDCTARRLHGGGLLRLESVQGAIEQAKSAAAALQGVQRPFTATPWFWSDQYDVKLQMAGLSGGAQRWALRGDIDSGSFSVYHFRDDALLAVDSVNAPKDHLLARKLLDARISPTPGQAADVRFDLAGLLAAQEAPAGATPP